MKDQSQQAPNPLSRQNQNLSQQRQLPGDPAPNPGYGGNPSMTATDPGNQGAPVSNGFNDGQGVGGPKPLYTGSTTQPTAAPSDPGFGQTATGNNNPMLAAYLNSGAPFNDGSQQPQTAEPGQTATDPANQAPVANNFNDGLTNPLAGGQSPLPGGTAGGGNTVTDPAQAPSVQNNFADHPPQAMAGSFGAPTPLSAPGQYGGINPSANNPQGPAQPGDPQQQTYHAMAGGAQSQPGAQPQGDLSNEWGSILSQLNLSGVPGAPNSSDFMGAMNSARDAAYKQSSGYLDPQWQNQQNTLQNQLANQGVVQGSEAWNKAMDDFGRQKEFAYNDARNQAMQQGLSAQGQFFNQGLASNQNAFSQALQGGQFSNSAQAQLAGQGLQNRQIQEQGTAAQQAAAAQVAAAGASANASMHNNDTQLSAQGDQNRFLNSMQMRNQGLNELLLKQRNPLDMANLLNQGTGVQQPNFTSTPGANVGGTDLASIINQAYQGQLTGYNAQTGANNSTNSALAAIIAAYMCDRRLKTNIKQIGKLTNGLPLYEFDYLWGEHAVGVMADEVENLIPEAIIPIGKYKAVNMAMLEAA